MNKGMNNKGSTVDKPDISVIIISWNAKHYLLDCLKSLNSSGRGKSIEIIVVDNASTDGSPEAVEKDFPGVKLVRNKTNRGFATANNIGIEESNGRYVCLINSDIKVMGNCLERLRDYMDSKSSIGILGPKILNPDMTLQCSCRSFPSLWNNFCTATGISRIFAQTRLFSGEQMFFFKHDVVSRVNVLVGCFLMVKREALNQVGPLDNRFFIYAEDIDWCRRFWNAGWEVVFFPEAQAIHYRGRSSSNAPTKFTIEQDRAVLQYWKKYHQIPSQVAILFIMVLKHVLRIGAGTLFLLIQPSKKTNTLSYINNHFARLFSLFSPQKTRKSTTH
jgi:GT2 family glycosyltransferase